MSERNEFREALESAVEDALAKLPEEVTSAVCNACDDERGRLLDENRELQAKLRKLNAAANRALDNLNMFIADHSDPGVEALGARWELWHSLTERTAAQDAAPPSYPAQHVWKVWDDKDRGATWAFYATEEDAKTGTITCWEEFGERCPDYSWRDRGDHSLELLAGDEPTGVRLCRHDVHGKGGAR